MSSFTFPTEAKTIEGIHDSAAYLGYKKYGNGGATRYVEHVLIALSELKTNNPNAFEDVINLLNVKPK